MVVGSQASWWDPSKDHRVLWDGEQQRHSNNLSLASPGNISQGSCCLLSTTHCADFHGGHVALTTHQPFSDLVLLRYTYGYPNATCTVFAMYKYAAGTDLASGAASAIVTSTGPHVNSLTVDVQGKQ